MYRLCRIRASRRGIIQEHTSLCPNLWGRCMKEGRWLRERRRFFLVFSRGHLNPGSSPGSSPPLTAGRERFDGKRVAGDHTPTGLSCCRRWRYQSPTNSRVLPLCVSRSRQAVVMRSSSNHPSSIGPAHDVWLTRAVRIMHEHEAGSGREERAIETAARCPSHCPPHG